MSHLPLDPMQVALLYENTAAVEPRAGLWGSVLTRLNEKLGATAGPFHAINGQDGSTTAMIGNAQNKLHITLELMQSPLGLDGFQGALTKPFYRGYQPHLIEAVTHHKAAILIGVGLGDVPFPLDHPLLEQLGMVDDIGGGQDQAKFELRLLVAQTVANIFNAMHAPTVVHWGQSHQLFTASAFAQFTDADNSMPLYVACGATSSGAKSGDSYLVGITAHGSQHMIGHLVTFEEDPRPMIRSYQSVLAFVQYCRQIGRVLKSGETIKEPNGDVIEVEALPPTEAIPMPQILLRLRAVGDAKPVKPPTASAAGDTFTLGAAVAWLKDHMAHSGSKSRTLKGGMVQVAFVLLVLTVFSRAM